jgi:hypothetical protein
MNEQPRVYFKSFRAFDQPQRRSTAFYLTGRSGTPVPDGGKNYIGRITWVEYSPEDFSDPGESFTLSGDEWKQDLMDDLWRAGIRPTDSPRATPELIAAKDDHIKDLRNMITAILPAQLKQVLKP